MNIEEAISYLEIERDTIKSMPEEFCMPYKINLATALDIVIEALEEKKEAEKNEPLTMEEICDMETGPIYVVPLNPNYCKYWKEWCAWDSNEKNAFVPGNAYKTWDIEDYGKEWIAYLREPEEVNRG